MSALKDALQIIMLMIGGLTVFLAVIGLIVGFYGAVIGGFIGAAVWVGKAVFTALGMM